MEFENSFLYHACTGDQQALKGRKLAVVILSRNRWTLIKPRLTEIAAAMKSAKPGAYTVVEIPNR